MNPAIKAFLWLVIFLFFQIVIANPIVLRYINEFKMDSIKWVLELTDIYHVSEPIALDGAYLTSNLDTAYFRSDMQIDQAYLVITEDSLQSPLRINPSGDTLTLFLSDHTQIDQFSFGESSFPAPSPGQSISFGAYHNYYLDNTPTIGFPNDTLNATGRVECIVTDTSGIPLRDVSVHAEYLRSAHFIASGITDSTGSFSVHVLASLIDFYLTKEGFLSRDVYVFARPETYITITAVMKVKPSSVTTRPVITEDYYLSDNYPNPFNAATTFTYKLPIDDYVELNIYDLSGRLVDRIYRGLQPAGQHKITWQPQNLASSVYIFELRSANVHLTQKCILLK